jgi:hypothetical protein
MDSIKLLASAVIAQARKDGDIPSFFWFEVAGEIFDVSPEQLRAAYLARVN